MVASVQTETTFAGISIVHLLQPAKTEKQKRAAGRPKVLTEGYMAMLLREHALITEWFCATHGRKPKSDLELLVAHFESELRANGLRASRMDAPSIRSRIKTLRNQLAEARKLAARIPKTSVYSGCIANHINAH